MAAAVVPWPPWRPGPDKISQHTARQVCAFLNQYIFIIIIFMAILVTTFCERANNHGGRRRPTAALWPHSRRHTALRNHTKKQVNVVISRK